MKPRAIILIVGGVLGAVCFCVAGFLALGAWASNDPATVARLSPTQTAQAQIDQATQAEPTLPAGAKLVLDESFDSNKVGFQFVDDPSIQTSLKDGAYQTHFGRIGVEITPLGLKLTNFIVAMDCKSFGYHAMCGLAFRMIPSADIYSAPSYRAYINNDYTFEEIPFSGPTFTHSQTSFARHPGDWNNMRIEVVGESAKVYLNQELIDQPGLTDLSLSSGDLGILVGLDNSAENGDSADLTVDNLKVWQLP